MRRSPGELEGNSLAPLLKNVAAPWSKSARTMAHHNVRKKEIALLFVAGSNLIKLVRFAPPIGLP
jgi:hypothetical protein